MPIFSHKGLILETAEDAKTLLPLLAMTTSKQHPQHPLEIISIPQQGLIFIWDESLQNLPSTATQFIFFWWIPQWKTYIEGVRGTLTNMHAPRVHYINSS